MFHKINDFDIFSSGEIAMSWLDYLILQPNFYGIKFKFIVDIFYIKRLQNREYCFHNKRSYKKSKYDIFQSSIEEYMLI